MSAHPASSSPHTSVPRIGGPGIRCVLVRIAVGDRSMPFWVRPSLVGLLVVTALLYLWNLGASGYANSFYAAAVEAGSTSWKALFFGSLDASNFITVDKPPASLWVMGLSARLFGFSSWSLLAPQALMGVASVALLFGAVRRSLATLGPRASAVGGLLAGAVLACTPAAALMFRFDNPDALLALLMTAAAYFVVRALPNASGKWLVLAGVALGFAFLTKMLEGLLVLPAFGVVYLIAARTTFLRRLVHLVGAAVALVVAAGWWVLAVALWPADARPYIGGSTNNTVLDLVFGYNGLGRIFGGSGNGGGGAAGAAGRGGGGAGFSGATGLSRLFSSEMGLEISWLLPAALLALVLGLVVTRRGGRTDPLRAALLLWGGWLVVTGLVFSFMSGTIHPYYTVALAPAVGGLVGVGGVLLWSRRSTWLGRIGLAVMLAGSGVWAFVLLSENATWLPWLRWVLVVGAVVSAGAFVVGSAARLRRVAAVAVVAGTLFGLGGSAAYAVATASVAHSGSIPSVGSAGGGSAGGSGGGGGSVGSSGAAAGGSGSSAAAGGTASLDALLAASTARWAAAVNGSQTASSLELSSGVAVMAIGGWSSDPTPSLAEFQASVAAGDIGYYVLSGQGGGSRGGSSSTASAIESWVTANYTATTVGSSTVYALGS